MMRAIRVAAFGGPEVCQLDSNVPVPVPSASEVLIRVDYAGLNPYDTYVRSGIYGARTFPYTPGGDCAGVVEAVGPQVNDFKVGDRVYTCGSLSGACAEYALAEQKTVFPLHGSHSFAQGAAIGVPYFTAYRAIIFNAQGTAGQSVLIHGGSGGVGLAAVQIAHARGFKVLATAGTDKGLQLVKDQGADAVFCHREQGYQQKILDATDGKGVDIIIEMAAGINLQADLGLLAPRGRVIVVGCRGTSTIDARQMMSKDTSVIGMVLFNSTQAEWSEMRATLWDGAEQGWMKPIVDKEYALADAASAHQDIIESKGALGNLVLKVH